MELSSKPSPRWLLTSHAIGEIASLMTRNSQYGCYPIVVIRLYVEPPVLVGQYRIFYDATGTPIGYVTWAFVSDDIADRLRSDHDYVLRLGEWNEGENLWITDFFALSGFTSTLARVIAGEMFPARSLSYLRRRPNRLGAQCKTQRAQRWSQDA